MTYLYIPTYKNIKLQYNKVSQPYILAFKSRSDVIKLPLRPDISVKYIKEKPPSPEMWKNMLNHATMDFPISKIKNIKIYNGHVRIHNKLDDPTNVEQWNIEQIHTYMLCDELINNQNGLIIIDHIIDKNKLLYDADIYNPPSSIGTVFDSILDEYF